MPKHLFGALALATTSIALAQAPSPNTAPATKHYRLTFVVDNGQGEAGRQSFVLDIPVVQGKTGAARASLISGDEGDAQSVVRQELQCSHVRPTATGLSLDIAMQSDREAPAIPGLISARHQHGQFQRSVDLQLNEPTRVTGEMHFRLLGNTDPRLAEALRQPAPTITITAEAL